jgi:hypothetical protein
MPLREVVVYSKSSVILLFLLSILVVDAGAQLAQSANASGCGFGAAELQSELDKSISHFDQDMNGEWRALNQRGCTLQAAMLLDVYNLEDVRSEKKGDNRGALFFHAGQLRDGKCHTCCHSALLKFSGPKRGRGEGAGPIRERLSACNHRISRTEQRSGSIPTGTNCDRPKDGRKQY